MNNDSNSGLFSAGSIIGLVLCIFLSIIIIFTLTVVTEVMEYPAGRSALIFAGINLLVITAVVTFGRVLVKITSLSSYVQVSFVTFLYTLFQFGHLFLFINEATDIGYLLYHMCILFLYLVIITPITLVGSKKNK
ncbi:MAG: hypothetical protein PHP79_02150 [Clostridia bacterium]|nr:hypothetical protein [Clostridia bacterium]